MLSMTMCTPFTGNNGASPGFDRASQRAKELSAAACDGADPPLALPLPHTRILHSRKGGNFSLTAVHLRLVLLDFIVPR